jgi:carbamate kinase
VGSDAEQRAIILPFTRPNDTVGFGGLDAPEIIAACDFARAGGKEAVIGALTDIGAMLEGSAGTRITSDADGVELAATAS